MKKTRIVFIALFTIICAGFFVVFPSAPARAAETDAFKKDVARFIEGKLKESGAAGLTLAFVDLDKGLAWTEGFGYADVKNKTKVTDKTIFKIASISKTFTAMALMQLWEAGKLNLDDPVVKYAPDFSIKPHPARGGRAADITLDMLAKHRSGILGDLMPGGRSSGGYNKDFLNNFPKVFHTMHLGDAPPAKFQGYSNAGVSLLGYVVARVGEPGLAPFDGFVKYTQENLFDKMGMGMTSYIIKDNMRPHFSKGHGRDGAEITANLHINGLPAGSMSSNAQDMAKYIQTILNKGKNVLKPETLDAMLRPEDKYKSVDYNDNIGRIWMTQYPFGREHPVRAHNGSVPGFLSVVMIMPGRNLGVFVSVNSQLGRGVHGEIARYALQKALEAKLGKSVDIPRKRPQSAPQKASRAELAKYVGFYVDAETSREIVMGKNDRLYMRVPEPNMQTRDIPLTHHSDGTFVAETGRRMAFAVAGKDMVLHDVVNGEKRNLAIRVEKPAVPAWFASWRGAWVLQNPVDDQEDEDDGGPGGLQRLVFGAREGVPYCMMHPVRFVDRNICYWETYGRAGGLVIYKTPDGNLMTSRGGVYKRMRQ